MALARAHGVPVPAVFAHSTEYPRPLMLLAWVEDATMLDAMLRAPKRTTTFGRSLGATQARIHQISMPDAPSPWPETLRRWLGPDEETLIRRLIELSNPPHHLLHLDYHPLNVLVNQQANVTAVLDWTNHAPGDPRFDAARTALMLDLAPLPADLKTTPFAAQREALTAAWRDGYASVNGPLDLPAEFYAAAAVMMLRDLTAKTGPAAIPAEDLAPIARAAAYWKNQAGIQ